MKVFSGLLLAGLLSLAACGKNLATATGDSSSPSKSDNSDQGRDSNSIPTDYDYEALAWESASKPERKEWSNYAFQVIDQDSFDQLDQATDAILFCPAYENLNRYQKINFWGMLIAGISYYESAWSPVSRMQETTMGGDPVTGQPVYSEGLLQLSYQDIQWAPFCEFDWNKDKYLSPTDPHKTILDPATNLNCGIKILADQVARKKKIVLSSGVYWATLKSDGKYQQISGIKAMTKRLSFCR